MTKWDGKMTKLYHARHHRLDGNVLYFIFIPGGVARRYAGLSRKLNYRMRRFVRAEQVGVAVDIGNDKTETGRPGKFFARRELQGGGVLIPGTVLLGLTLAGRLVKERNGVNVREDGNPHAADCREVNAPRQVSAIDPANGLNSG